MYSRAVPMPDDCKEDEEKPLYDESRDMNSPENYEDFDNEEVIYK